MKLRGISTKEEIIEILNQREPDLINQITQEAYKVKVENIGSKVFLRGLIELSNICVKNCLYCGIRKDNHHVHRYELTENQVLDGQLHEADPHDLICSLASLSLWAHSSSLISIFQPNTGIISEARTAAKIAPTCAPIPTTEVALAKCFLSNVSETRDIHTPYSPPAPIPAIKRNK